MKLKILTLLLLILIAKETIQASLVEMFGMSYLLDDLARIDKVKLGNNQTTTIYTVNPNIINFLATFRSRTEFCNYKCPSFFNLPCFIMFSCNIQTRNFILMIVTPIIAVIMLGICCGRGIWTFRCWGRYFAIFTGIAFFAWIVDRCVKGNRLVKARQQQLSKLKQKIQVQVQLGPQTTKTIKDKQINNQ